MRAKFREWYPLDEQALARLWQNATIVLDSNVLLGLYQYRTSVLEEFFEVLTHVKDRLWLPYQIADEYHRHREQSIPQQGKVLEQLISEIENVSSGLMRLTIPEHHPVLPLDDLEGGQKSARDALDGLLQIVRAALDKTQAQQAAAADAPDPILERITTLYDGRVGERPSEAEIQALMVEGRTRYTAMRPPGYKDVGKDEPGRYSDLLIWKEILAVARTRGDQAHGTIFVTNDRKDDWWLRRRDELLGPRRELIREYYDSAAGDFAMYTPSDFLKGAHDILTLAVSGDAIAEVRRLSLESPVVSLLRSRRMVLPSHAERINALGLVFDAFASRHVTFARDLRPLTDNLDRQSPENFASLPFFFSLVNESYGPLAVESDVSRRLSDREVALRREFAEREAFVDRGHAAWLAQALFRVWHENLREDLLLSAFFGDDVTAADVDLFRRARDLAGRDLEARAAH